MSFFVKKSKADKKKKNENPLKNAKNPFAQVGKNLGGGNRKFAGEGNSLGGQRPGKLLHFSIPDKGPVGVKVSTSLCIVYEFVSYIYLYIPSFG